MLREEKSAINRNRPSPASDIPGTRLTASAQNSPRSVNASIAWSPAKSQPKYQVTTSGSETAFPEARSTMWAKSAWSTPPVKLPPGFWGSHAGERRTGQRFVGTNDYAQGPSRGQSPPSGQITPADAPGGSCTAAPNARSPTAGHAPPPARCAPAGRGSSGCTAPSCPACRHGR